MKYNDSYRMYGLVPYQLTGNQKGIQFLHAVQEYNNFIMQCNDYPTSHRDKALVEAFKEWRLHCKTVIMLNGGTTNTSLENPGTLNQHIENLKMYGLKVVDFKEPDLGDQVLGACFILPESCYSKSLIEFWDWTPMKKQMDLNPKHEQIVKEFRRTLDFTKIESNEVLKPMFETWSSSVLANNTECGILGQNLGYIRYFIKQFKLA